MAGSLERAQLHVEGPDDEHVIKHLLHRHGINSELPNVPTFNQMGGVGPLLQGMALAVELSGERPAGFVLDADSPLSSRWQAVRDRLAPVGVSLPERPPAEGFIGESQSFGTRVGVWLMPDNQHDGKLETLLLELINAKDLLIEHATSSTRQARQIDARFSEPDEEKAVIHCWLAWQEEPGRPYGTAIRARYFTHDSPAVSAFVSWFKRLYSIP